MRTFAQKQNQPQELASSSPTRSNTAAPGPLSPDPILHLQRAIGNQASQRMLHTDAEELRARLTGMPSPRFGHDFSRIPVHPPAAGAIRTKLAINQPGDEYEREADRISEPMIHMPEPQLQRTCPCGGGCPRCQAEHPSQQHERLQTKRVQASDTRQIAAPPIVHDILRSPGLPLDPATRAFMEPRFGHDFSRVRVHTDQVASRSAEAVAAQAYTVGSDIVFGAGRYAPASRDGQRLLAHELAHVVQQQSGPAPMLLRQREPQVASPSAYPEWKPADAVVELRWLKGNDWEITLSGVTSLESARAMLWPNRGFLEGYRMPSTVTMIFNVAITDPIERGWFTISGLEPFHLEYMEPSIAAIFRDRGVVDDTKDSPELATARDAFRKNNSKLGEWRHSAIHVALRRATRANADLMLAFYRYYSSHDLERDDMSGLGDTSSGDTEISERVLMLEKDPKRTSDPLSLLGSTLIHEFVHTPQGPKELGGEVTQLPKEAKAYAIELLFSERMGDTTRAADIEKQWLSNDSLIMGMGADKVFNRTYTIISKLYEIIDSKGGTEAAMARRMIVEFISKNEADYGGELRDFISKN